MALSVKQLQDKKTRLEASKVKLTEDLQIKLSKIDEQIVEVDENLGQQIATLQAQIDAIRGIADTVDAPVMPEDGEDNLPEGYEQSDEERDLV